MKLSQYAKIKILKKKSTNTNKLRTKTHRKTQNTTINMRLVESHIISKNHEHFKECDRLCFASKNLYNQAMFRIKKEYEETTKFKNYNNLAKELASEKQADFIALNTKVSQQTLMLLERDFKSYFKGLKAYKKDPTNFTGCPQLPHFKHKTRGRCITIFTIQAISKKELKKGIVQLASSKIRIKTDKNVQQVRVIPLYTEAYKIEVIYTKEEPTFIKNDHFAGVDIGLNNLATVVSNHDLKPFIINGKPLKSINQFYNKKLAILKSELPFYIDEKGEKRQRKSSKKIQQLTHKRNLKVNDYLHKNSRLMVNILKQANISTVVIGKNDQWKTTIDIGSKNNQQFVSIPHAKFIDMLSYKLRLEGIEVICREESYTSKCSFLDDEAICKQEIYKGKRIKRGLFKSANGRLINADVNGACNILKKEIPNSFRNGIEAMVVSPIRISNLLPKSYKIIA